MLTLQEFVAAVLEFLPLYVVMHAVPVLIYHIGMQLLVGSYLVRGVKASLWDPVLLRAAQAGTVTAISAVLIAPFAEEIIFRGIPMLIHPVLAVIATVAWALYHPLLLHSELLMQAINAPKARVYAAVVLAGAVYLSAGIFYLVIWLRGFEYGAVAIFYHLMHNLMVVVASGLPRRRKEEVGRPLVRPARPVPQPIIREPAQPPQPLVRTGRRGLRRVDMEQSTLFVPIEQLVKKRQ